MRLAAGNEAVSRLARYPPDASGILRDPFREKGDKVGARVVAILIVLELKQFPHEFVDSREWQTVLLPKGLIKRGDGKKNHNSQWKELSWKVGKRLFPEVDEKLFADYDGLLIAEYLRRRDACAVNP